MEDNAIFKEKYSRRLHELEEQFHDLEAEIEETPVKKAISVLHGMIQEVSRTSVMATFGSNATGFSVQDIADMYRHAPKMEGNAMNEPLPVGIPAPDFTLPDPSGNFLSLSSLKGQPVVLVFYPLDWSPGCSQQLDLYQAESEEFEKRGVRLIGISVDSIYSHGAWAAVRGINFQLLSDFHPKGEIARRYQVYREQDGFSERALYIIDAQGIIQYAYISPYLHHVPDIYELFGKLDELLVSQVVT